MLWCRLAVLWLQPHGLQSSITYTFCHDYVARESSTYIQPTVILVKMDRDQELPKRPVCRKTIRFYAAGLIVM